MSDSSASKLQNQSAFIAIAELLDRVGHGWAAIGGRVANDYRVTPRATLDYDFYISSLVGLREALEDATFTVTQ